MSRTPRATTRQRGLSLLETTIGLSLTILVIGTAVPSFQPILGRHRLEGHASQLRSDLLDARQESLNRGMPVQVSFKASTLGNCYMLHTGSAKACDCSAAAPRCTPGAQEIKTVALPSEPMLRLQWKTSSASSFSFNPWRGTASSYGSVDLSSQQQAIRLIVNSMGRVRGCAPAMTIAGYRPC